MVKISRLSRKKFRHDISIINIAKSKKSGVPLSNLGDEYPRLGTPVLVYII